MAAPAVSAGNVLPSGRYEPRNLLDGPNGAGLTVNPDGRLHDYGPLTGPIGQKETLVLELTSR